MPLMSTPLHALFEALSGYPYSTFFPASSFPFKNPLPNFSLSLSVKPWREAIGGELLLRGIQIREMEAFVDII